MGHIKNKNLAGVKNLPYSIQNLKNGFSSTLSVQKDNVHNLLYYLHLKNIPQQSICLILFFKSYGLSAFNRSFHKSKYIPDVKYINNLARKYPQST